ncbi:hypothetical protein [Peribacillus sp. B2I2]|uniref:hypothetical protein n=1 Tax=Peribacillus sp. B2I2 TaxID=3156468 RepID=UPI0035152A63
MEISADEGISNEILSEEIGTNELTAEDNDSIENSDEGEENGSPRRVNIFKKMWLENMIKASKGIYKEED